MRRIEILAMLFATLTCHSAEIAKFSSNTSHGLEQLE